MPAASPRPYVTFPGTAREALTFYRQVFGGQLTLFTFAEFNRDDGNPESVAHGELTGLVSVGGSDAADGQSSIRIEGLLLSLLGAAEPVTLHRWFDALAEGGQVVDPLTVKPWGASDGQVTDRFGLSWLIGYQSS